MNQKCVGIPYPNAVSEPAFQIIVSGFVRKPIQCQEVQEKGLMLAQNTRKISKNAGNRELLTSQTKQVC